MLHFVIPKTMIVLIIKCFNKILHILCSRDNAKRTNIPMCIGHLCINYWNQKFALFTCKPGVTLKYYSSINKTHNYIFLQNDPPFRKLHSRFTTIPLKTLYGPE